MFPYTLYFFTLILIKGLRVFVEADLKYVAAPTEDFEAILKIMNRSSHRDAIVPPTSLVCSKVKDYTFVECNGVMGIAYLGRKHSRSLWLVRCLACGKYSIQNSGSLENRIKYDHVKCNNCKRILHNESRSLFCKQWYRLRDKCLNEASPGFKYCGGKGIKLTEEWKQYANFKKDMFSSYAKGMRLKIKKGEVVFNKETCYWEL